MLGIRQDEIDLDLGCGERKIDRAAVTVLTGRENKLVIISNRCANPSKNRH